MKVVVVSMVMTLMLGTLVHAWHANRRGRQRKPQPTATDELWTDQSDYYDEYDYTNYQFPGFNSNYITRALDEEGNVTLPSRNCKADSCSASWGAWQSWEACNTPLPGKYGGPKCHNTLRYRERFCVGDSVCVMRTWELCLHNDSCTGEWTSWSQYEGNCSVGCTKNMTRRRICMENGIESAGLCEGNTKEAVQYELKVCEENSCSDSHEDRDTLLLISLSIASGMLLTIIITIVLICIRRRQNRKDEQHPISSSSSFLFGYWRMVSSRFTRKQPPPSPSTNQEVAIGRNYNAIHVYENPGEYAQVKDSTNLKQSYDAIDPEYGIPLYYGGNERRRRGSTVTSVESRYAVIGSVNPYVEMSVGSAFGRDMKRAQSLDCLVDAPEMSSRSRPLPGAAIRAPRYRGATHHVDGLGKGLRKKPSNVGSGVAAKIMRKKSQSADNLNSKLWSSAMTIQEDRYGYLVPNNAHEKDASHGKTQTFGGFENPSFYRPNKSASLPYETNVYVTMKDSYQRQPRNDKPKADIPVSRKVDKLRSVFDS